jgi:hypothetical protein
MDLGVISRSHKVCYSCCRPCETRPVVILGQSMRRQSFVVGLPIIVVPYGFIPAHTASSTRSRRNTRSSLPPVNSCPAPLT